MDTVVIQIGNSDNKLTQNEWARYAEHMRSAIAANVFRCHFSGGSDWDAPWQNACWVCEVAHGQRSELIEAIRKCREQFKQESAAVTIGETLLV